MTHRKGRIRFISQIRKMGLPRPTCCARPQHHFLNSSTLQTLSAFSSSYFPMSTPQELELWKDKGESRGQGMVGCWSGEVQQDPPPTEGRRSLDEAEVGAVGSSAAVDPRPL